MSKFTFFLMLFRIAAVLSKFANIIRQSDYMHLHMQTCGVFT